MTRTVSDASGAIEQAEIDLEHACVSCAVREDIVPTLERLAEASRWESIIAQLPVGAEARQVCRVIAFDHDRAPHLRVGAVIAAIDGTRIVDDVLGDDLLCDRSCHTSQDDRRGVGEVCAGQVEYADVVTVIEDAGTAELDLLRALARPGALVVPDGADINATQLVGIHDHDVSELWITDIQPETPPGIDSDHVWTLALVSDRPVHPDRLRTNIALIGGGPRRSRGCFWLPTRPGVACAWGGAGASSASGSPAVGGALSRSPGSWSPGWMTAATRSRPPSNTACSATTRHIGAVGTGRLPATGSRPGSGRSAASHERDHATGGDRPAASPQARPSARSSC